MHHPNQTPLELLADEGVPTEIDFVHLFRATYNFECFFAEDELPTTSTAKTSYTARHVPLSFSVCSNVPEFESPVCFISEGDPQNLVNRTWDYLGLISTKAFQILKGTCSEKAYEHLEALGDEKDASPPTNTLT